MYHEYEATILILLFTSRGPRMYGVTKRKVLGRTWFALPLPSFSSSESFYLASVVHFMPIGNMISKFTTFKKAYFSINS